MCIRIWKADTAAVVTPDDLRIGRVEAGPLHGAATVAAEVYTVPCRELPRGSCCSLRLDLETFKRLQSNQGLFTVTSTLFWNSFASDRVALAFADGAEFKSIPTIFETQRGA